MPRRFWTQARIAELKRLWGAGKTADAIGAALGGITRSAVLGKVFRLRLVAANRGRSAPAPDAPPARRRAGKAPPPVEAKARRKTLLHLTNECCRWPYGELGERRYFFCGAAGADVARGIPYCPRHMARAYIVPPSLVKPLHKLIARASWKSSAAFESSQSPPQTQHSPDEAKRNPGQPLSLQFCSRTSLGSVRATESRKRKFG
jgi:GcrA cell cycle regulator